MTNLEVQTIIDNGGVEEIPDELIVSTLEDENDGDFSAGDLSLREAIAIAESSATITFDSNLSGGSIVLNQGELLIDKDLTIQGLGANNLTINGNNESRIFQLDDGIADNQISVLIAELTIENGRTGSGTQPEINGGGFLNRENLTIINSALVDNSAGNGGAIYNTGRLRFESSLVDQTGDGTGPINNDGGVASIVNSTITNSNVPGVSAIVNSNGGELELANSTITNNSGFGAAVFNSENSTATVVSTIIANNSAELPEEEGRDDILGNYISQGNNLIGSINGGSGFDEPSDIVGTADNPIIPQLGQLQDNGGSTQTIALLDDSPAIDAGSNPNGLAFDQRGEGFNRTIGNGTDIGAFEVQTVIDNGGGEIPDELIVSTLEDEEDGDFSVGDLSLREAIAIAESGETISFDSNLSGGTINLVLGQLTINQDLTIQGLGADQLTLNTEVEGNFDSPRIFNVDDGDANNLAQVNISGLTITGADPSISEATPDGLVPFRGGGGIFNSEELIVDSSVITDNNSATFGGGIFNEGILTLTNSSVTNNDAVGSFFRGANRDGGGIVNQGIATISNSTISNNNGSEGGGIVNRESIIVLQDNESASTANLTIVNSTIAENSGEDILGRIPLPPVAGAGILNNGGETRITSSIIANNRTDILFFGGDSNQGITSGGNNLVGNSNAFVGVASDLIGTVDTPIDPLLGELQDNGGATPTIALLDGSPAINAGSNPNGLATDQRGEGFNRTIGNATDIGAFEVQSVTISEIVGTAGGDVLSGTEASDRLIGLDGKDTIRALDGDDTVQGDNGNDSLDGGTGNDFLDGASGFDSLFGGDGNDTLDGGIGNDSLDGGAGEDQLFGFDGRDTLLGREGNDSLEGGFGSDSLDGGAGNDTLLGDDGRDTLVGGSGGDLLTGDAGVDFLQGGDGEDALNGGADNDTILGGNGNDIIGGGSGIDSLDGGAGNDRLFASDGNDSLFGGAGNDTLTGELGDDILRGDDGEDTFVLNTGSGTDFIVDFGRGNNLLGLSSGISFGDLAFSGNNIILGTETLATLNGFDATSLTESDFVDL